ncbi:ergothioneine biosynthesis protein EgtB [Adhaeretor mobilis]|nr:ergothioneine biosynthesis protein EgtB [Adhaeretor mobilis]
MAATSSTPAGMKTPDQADSLVTRYADVRGWSKRLVEGLQTEDFLLQSMPDASPAKWHLAHTTWFFETFVLAKNDPAYQPVSKDFSFLFNSYYNAVGERHPRAERGLLSRPSMDEVWNYRRETDERMAAFLTSEPATEWLSIVELGLHHEQQHQELLLTDIKHAFSRNLLKPALVTDPLATKNMKTVEARWIPFDENVVEIGHDADGSFCFDNELPRHRVFLEPFEIASRLVTCGEYLEFINDRGYERPEFWLSEGWDAVQANDWEMPLYWQETENAWHHFTLHGRQPIDLASPVCHVNLYEADAYARWKGCRLPTEAEWEHAAQIELEKETAIPQWHPQAALDDEDRQWMGHVWQWTGSQYTPYPGYRAAAGALGEYNGKFMCNQHVLRGSSCATPASHRRPTYRNFFHASKRWQFTGIRLARSC